MTGPYRTCCRCVMDTSDPDITFDDAGVCNHCHRHDVRVRELPARQPDAKERLEKLVAGIKRARRGDYDAIMGVSGGVDSSYVAYVAKQLGLKPLAIHFDNGWNSEIAVRNIENVVKRLGIDLETYVIDWEEFRDIQRSYFMAHVIDLEVPTDHAIFAAMHKLAVKRRIRYILSGSNIWTESVMPPKWLHMKWDLRNLLAIQARFGTVPIRSFPTNSIWKMGYYHYLGGLRIVDLLNYVRYRKQEALGILAGELGWQNYGGKHYESVFTKFYQAHILPVKFGVDKRRCHYSNLVLNGEITREQALVDLQAPLYDAAELARDREFVLKKLGFSAAWFDEYLAAPAVPHEAFPSHARLANRLIRVRRRLA